jgi:hypothetical protein
MDWQTLVKNINGDTARAFVTAARHVIDALLIEADRLQQAQGPVQHDYNADGLSRAGPPGGWLSHDELRDAVCRMSEAIAAEKWTDGVVATLRILVLLGGLA